jgi:hypothetical protein
LSTQTAVATASHVGPRKLLASVVQQVTTFRFLLVSAIVAKVVWTCRSRIADPDIWWHLRNAEFLVTRHKFPLVDTYSFTVAGTPYLSHEWLSELLFYCGYRAWGFRGVFVVYAAALSLLMLGVWYLCADRNKDPLVATAATLGGGVLAMVGFGPRMHVIGWLCFLGVFAILQGYRQHRRPAFLWVIPPLFWLWINCHATWILGLFFFLLITLAGLIRHDIGPLVAAPWSPTELQTLQRTLALSVAALFVNPFGYRLLYYPIDAILHQPLNITWVEEWASVNFNDQRGGLVIAALGIIFLAALMQHRRWRIDDVLLTAFVTYCGLHHIRLLMLTGIVLPVILVNQAGTISSYDPAQERRKLNAFLLVIALLLMVAGFPRATYLQQQIDQQFPSGAVAYLRTQAETGHMFNAVEWGGYFEWTIPEVKCFIDPRMDIFEHKGVLQDYFSIATLHQSDEVLDRYRISYVVFPKRAPLTYALSKDAQWRKVYADNMTVIFRRATATTERPRDSSPATGE